LTCHLTKVLSISYSYKTNFIIFTLIYRGIDMQNITCNQTQQISGGTFGVSAPQIGQLAILTGFVMPKALFSYGLSATSLNPNGLAVKFITEAGSVMMTAAAMVAGNHFYPETVVVAAKNQTAV
jgi:hypothetical protein